ncbi:bifunctional chorismate mutase/prephenate dehydrogenase [Natronogracilivirga saccharolytica]|uniref:chorismate mutase n=1 Tax=Natronogracilivirga saccharolytica TaxID=2812953 RepID=A0A8J7RRE4_9BACT|nr:bifunctional chorismate mutase/prephenate dehydrogenase [Natronogracilivirga saccharolytica]MBP3191577.1 bifunctional chorismate mutase/prephenate dehydrogenase [Natronogracilivirga saccharolytica]
MSEKQKSLESFRNRIDEIDDHILKLLQERNETVKKVIDTKIENNLPIFVADREEEKIAAFRNKAAKLGLDVDWAEDFLRMIMSSSRAYQSGNNFPVTRAGKKSILLVGGRGGMGRLYANIAEATGHEVRILDRDDWDQAEELTRNLDLVIITVPIKITEETIARIGPFLSEETILADFTSNKSHVIDAMLHAHSGPVVALHPMHGPDVMNVSKQLMMVCHGRGESEYEWLIEQFKLWGLRIKYVDPEQHDRAMHLIQGLRHFVALLHGSFMKEFELKPEDMADFSSPIYRAELMMTGRIFAQDAELYADIVFSNFERRTLLIEFLEHHHLLADLVKNNDRDGFIREFRQISEFFGNFADQALEESSYMINRLADRFG